LGGQIPLKPKKDYAGEERKPVSSATVARGGNEEGILEIAIPTSPD